MRKVETIERFHSKLHEDEESGCWFWCGSLQYSGYGQFSIGKKNCLAHRVSYEMFTGPTHGKFVLHSCDTRCCVNPDHLFLGDHEENMNDMKKKGRADNRKGSRNPHAKLNDETVRYIRTKPKPLKALSKETGISTRHLRDVQSGVYWSHVK